MSWLVVSRVASRHPLAQHDIVPNFTTVAICDLQTALSDEMKRVTSAVLDFLKDLLASLDTELPLMTHRCAHHLSRGAFISTALVHWINVICRLGVPFFTYALQQMPDVLMLKHSTQLELSSY